MNEFYLISQIAGFIAFILSLSAYHRKEKNKIFKTMILANLLDISIISTFVALENEKKNSYK